MPAFYPYTIDQVTAGQHFTTDCQITHAGPITISDATYHADVRLTFAESRNGYHVNIPLSGGLQSRHGDAEVDATAATAAVYAPHGETSIARWAAHTRVLAVKLDRGTVDQALSAALRRPGSPTPLAPSIDLRAGHGRSWAALLRLLVAQLGDPDSVLHEPMAAMPFTDTIVNGFLMATSPAYRQAMDRPAERMRPAAIRDATDVIDAGAHTELTVSEIARRSHVSVRTLQEGFRRHLGTTPMAYLRSVRLARAHAELRAGDPSRLTVGLVSRRWGFTNPARFAQLHRSAYGEFPAETLRRPSS